MQPRQEGETLLLRHATTSANALTAVVVKCSQVVQLPHGRERSTDAPPQTVWHPPLQFVRNLAHVSG